MFSWRLGRASEIKDQLTLGQNSDDLRGKRARGIEDGEGDGALEWEYNLTLSISQTISSCLVIEQQFNMRPSPAIMYVMTPFTICISFKFCTTEKQCYR